MSSIISLAAARKDPAKYYYRVICTCFSKTGKPQVMVYSKAEWIRDMQDRVVNGWRKS